MSRDLTTAVQAEVEAEVKAPILLAQIETSGGTIRAWTGIGDLVWDGEVFQGTGAFGGVSPVEETSELKATGIKFILDGVPVEQIAAAQLVRHGGAAKLWLAFMDSQNRVIEEPYLLFDGVTDVPSLEDNPDGATISLTCETEFFDQRPRISYYTPEDQKLIDSTDRGFDFVASLQDQDFVWG